MLNRSKQEIKYLSKSTQHIGTSNSMRGYLHCIIALLIKKKEWNNWLLGCWQLFPWIQEV